MKIIRKFFKDRKINKYIIAGSFLNTFKIKNYYFCLPDRSGIKNMVKKIKENLKSYNFQEPEPIYIKEHYAKKYD